MSGVSVTVQDAEVVAELKRLQSALTDMLPVFEEIGHGWRSFADLCFREESDPWGHAWEQLSETTLIGRGKDAVGGRGKSLAERSRVKLITKKGNTKSKALRAMLSAKILHDTGRLASSITYSATAKSLKLGTDVIYGAAQFLGMKKGYAGTMRNGSPIPWGDIPPRPAIPIRPGGEVALPDQWRDFALEVLRDRLAGVK